ncbi:MAG: hypothetical protein R2932_50610 [Caldilineaceae bacterium]
MPHWLDGVHSGAPPLAFTVGFDEAAYDESALATLMRAASRATQVHIAAAVRCAQQHSCN